MADVLIIGGGPVGLFMAALLLQHGVAVRVLEQRTTPDTHSRAIGIHPPALEALGQIGVARVLVAGGVRIRRGIAVAAGRTLAEMSFAGVSETFPYVLSLPQARTEAVLEQRVRELDPDALLRGVRLRQLHDDDGRVTVETTTDGSPLRYAARLIIAADGVRSSVRALKGILMRAKDYPDSYLMGDFADSTNFGPDAALFLESEGIVESFPLPGQLRRWVVRLDAAKPDADARWLVQRILKRTGIDVDPGTNSMLSSFGVRSRVVRRMVAGRTVLIGDAAHEVSPIGGQGMNLGWLDAAALVPAVLAQLQGESGAGPLRNFERTRLRAAAKAVRQAEINMALGRPLPIGVLTVRNRAISAAAGVPAVNSLVARRFTMH